MNRCIRVGGSREERGTNGVHERGRPIFIRSQNHDHTSRTGVDQRLGEADFNLAPGDIVSLYATAKDARNTSQTDMFFIEAQPFEREYSQSQQGGGGDGGGGGGLRSLSYFATKVRK